MRVAMLRRTVRRRNLVADMVTELKHHLIAHLVTNTLSVEYMRYTAILRSEVASSRSTSMKRSLRLIAWRQRQSALMTTLMKTLEDVNRLNQKIPQLAAQVERDNAMAIMIAEQEIEDAEIAEQEENIQARKRRKRRRADEAKRARLGDHDDAEEAEEAEEAAAEEPAVGGAAEGAAVEGLPAEAHPAAEAPPTTIPSIVFPPELLALLQRLSRDPRMMETAITESTLPPLPPLERDEVMNTGGDSPPASGMSSLRIDTLTSN